MNNIPVALQAYSLRQTFAETPLKTMKTIKEIGFSGIEFYGNFFKPALCRALLEETGLVCAGWHTQITDLEGEKFGPTLERNLAVGNKFIIVPWFKAPTADEWKSFAERLNAVAEKLAPYGVRTGFHCHAHEFEAVDGELPWNIVAANTGDNVVLQLDTGNAMSGGADILATLAAYPGRNQSIHWKPWSAKEGFKVAVGSDDQNWEELLRWSAGAGRTEWIVLEYEAEEPVENIKRSMEYMQTL